MRIVVLLYVCVNKVDQIEHRTKRKAKDLYNVTKEVISQNNDVIEMETTVEDIKGNDNNNDSSKNKVSEENDGGIADFHNKKEENDKELYKATKLDEEDKKKNTDLSNNTNYYIVKKGDALVDISRRIYGTVKKVEAIKRVNDLKDEDKIYIGQRLVMP
jgi:nucleoid-associated protein YgaU